MLRRLSMTAIAFLLGIVSVLADEITVEGSCTFVMPHYMSEAEGRETAVRKARLQALADEFGTVISQEVWTDVRNDNSNSSIAFWQSGASLVKGEWLSDVKDPEFVKSIGPEGETILSVKVKGKARALKSLPLDLKAFVSLPGAGLPQDRFLNDSRFTLNFKSPENGFIAVYLGDEEGDVCRLLPFSQESVSSFHVNAMQDYEFFTSQKGVEEQYRLLTQKPRERNMIYVVYARNDFSRPFDRYNPDRNLRILKRADFLDWVARLRSADTSVQIQTIPVEIIGR